MKRVAILALGALVLAGGNWWAIESLCDDHGELLPDGAIECQNLCRTKTVVAFANDDVMCECEWP